MTLIRGGLVAAYFRTKQDREATERWAHVYTAGALAGGLVWSGLAVIWDSDWPIAYQAVPILTLLGLSAAAITSNAPRFSSFAAFAFPQVSGIALVMLLEKEQAFVNLGILVFIYSGVISLAANNYHRSLRQSLAHQIHNSGLLDELRQNLSRERFPSSKRKKYPGTGLRWRPCGSVVCGSAGWHGASPRLKAWTIPCSRTAW